MKESNLTMLSSCCFLSARLSQSSLVGGVPIHHKAHTLWASKDARGASATGSAWKLIRAEVGFEPPTL